MKFMMPTQELNFLVSKCANIIPPKPTMPVLGNLLIEAREGLLTLTATDMMVSLRYSTEVKVIQEGITTLPAKRLAQLLRELTATNVEIEMDANHQAKVHANSSTFRLPGMKADDFPALPDLSEVTKIVVKQTDLKSMFYRTAFSVANDETRHVLMGVFLQIARGRATFSATDGKRLARSFLAVDVDPGYNGSFIIPIKAVNEVLGNLSDTETDMISLCLMTDKVAFEMPGKTIITKLLLGDYPDVNRVIPESIQNIISLHREELTTLLRQVILFTNEERAVRFTFSQGELHLSANTELGEGKVSMPVNYHGEKFDMSFSSSFFLDVLKHSKSETVNLGVNDSFNPGVIMDQNSSNYVSSEMNPLFILMPMCLREA